jgi:type III secretion protein N (ATPase)
MIARGQVLAVRGGLLEARLPAARLGEAVRVQNERGTITATITSLRDGTASIAPHGSVDGIASGDSVSSDPAALTLPLGTVLLGRSIDAAGTPIDGGDAIRGRRVSSELRAPAVPARGAVHEPLWTGVRAIDGLLTIGRGARIGLFGAPGAGKSTLLHTLAHGAQADAIVIGLIGERGREAEEWTRKAPARASIICATSDCAAAERVRAAQVAMAQSAVLRSRGLQVLLVLDSLARYAAALRELAVEAGESTGRAGYPPSVFAELARYIEIGGPALGGSITMIASVLSDGDERDPVSEAARSLLDGHVQLSTALAQAGWFPAIDVPASASRTMAAVVDGEHAADAAILRDALAELAKTHDARAFGVMPSEPKTVRAIGAEPQIEAFLRQGPGPESAGTTLSALRALADTLR